VEVLIPAAKAMEAEAWRSAEPASAVYSFRHDHFSAITCSGCRVIDIAIPSPLLFWFHLCLRRSGPLVVLCQQTGLVLAALAAKAYCSMNLHVEHEVDLEAEESDRSKEI